MLLFLLIVTTILSMRQPVLFFFPFLSFGKQKLKKVKKLTQVMQQVIKRTGNSLRRIDAMAVNTLFHPDDKMPFYLFAD